MGIPVDRKPERAVQEKIRDKSVILCLIGSLCIQNPLPTSSSDGIDQSASSSTRSSSDETLEDIKAIAELEPSGIILFT